MLRKIIKKFLCLLFVYLTIATPNFAEPAANKAITTFETNNSLNPFIKNGVIHIALTDLENNYYMCYSFK